MVISSKSIYINWPLYGLKVTLNGAQFVVLAAIKKTQILMNAHTNATLFGKEWDKLSWEPNNH